MNDYVSDIAFTPAVKVEQEKRGSRGGYAKMAERKDWRDCVDEDLRGFLAERDSFYLATANSQGQPYIQHRGGPKGFLKVLDEKRLAFADFAGNKQYITLGNLAENDKAYIFLMDYANRRRIKIWGRAEFVEGDEEILSRVSLSGYQGKVERAILFTIEAWDVNCPQHITRRYDEPTIAVATEKLTARISALEAEIADLRAQLSVSQSPR